MPETITQAEAPITPKGLCTSTVQERRSLMGTVSAAGWPFSEGTGLISNRIQAPCHHRGCVGVGVEQGRETGLTPHVQRALSHPQGHSTTVLMRLYSYFILSRNAALKERWRAQENQQHGRGGNSIHVIHGQREREEGSGITENSAVTALGFTKVSFLWPLVLFSILSKLVR